MERRTFLEALSYLYELMRVVLNVRHAAAIVHARSLCCQADKPACCIDRPTKAMRKEVDREDQIAKHNPGDQFGWIKLAERRYLTDQVEPPAEPDAPSACDTVAGPGNEGKCHCRPNYRNEGKMPP